MLLRDTTNVQPNARTAAPGPQPVKTFTRRVKPLQPVSTSDSPADATHAEAEEESPALDGGGGDVCSLAGAGAGAAWIAQGLNGRRASTFVPFPSLHAAADYLSRRKGNALKLRQRLEACLAELAGQYAELDSFELAVEEASPAKEFGRGKQGGACACGMHVGCMWDAWGGGHASNMGHQGARGSGFLSTLMMQAQQQQTLVAVHGHQSSMGPATSGPFCMRAVHTHPGTTKRGGQQQRAAKPRPASGAGTLGALAAKLAGLGLAPQPQPKGPAHTAAAAAAATPGACLLVSSSSDVGQPEAAAHNTHGAADGARSQPCNSSSSPAAARHGESASGSNSTSPDAATAAAALSLGPSSGPQPAASSSTSSASPGEPSVAASSSSSNSPPCPAVLAALGPGSAAPLAATASCVALGMSSTVADSPGCRDRAQSESGGCASLAASPAPMATARPEFHWQPEEERLEQQEQQPGCASTLTAQLSPTCSLDRTACEHRAAGAALEPGASCSTDAQPECPSVARPASAMAFAAAAAEAAATAAMTSDTLQSCDDGQGSDAGSLLASSDDEREGTGEADEQPVAPPAADAGPPLQRLLRLCGQQVQCRVDPEGGVEGRGLGWVGDAMP